MSYSSLLAFKDTPIVMKEKTLSTAIIQYQYSISYGYGYSFKKFFATDHY